MRACSATARSRRLGRNDAPEFVCAPVEPLVQALPVTTHAREDEKARLSWEGMTYGK